MTISSSSSGGNHTLPLFDPGLGNLVGIDLAVELEVLQNFSLENEGPKSRTDFAGSSGKKIEGAKSRGTAMEKYLELSDFVASSQNETLSLPVSMDINSAVRGNAAFMLSTIAESKMCVIYTYEHTSQNDLKL